jgi:hypothetical protein
MRGEIKMGKNDDISKVASKCSAGRLQEAGVRLTCEEYEDVWQHINSIGMDIWEKMPQKEKAKDIHGIVSLRKYRRD